jgi:hypothetical protein
MSYRDIGAAARAKPYLRGFMPKGSDSVRRSTWEEGSRVQLPVLTPRCPFGHGRLVDNNVQKRERSHAKFSAET